MCVWCQTRVTFPVKLPSMPPSPPPAASCVHRALCTHHCREPSDWAPLACPVPGCPMSGLSLETIGKCGLSLGHRETLHPSLSRSSYSGGKPDPQTAQDPRGQCPKRGPKSPQGHRLQWTVLCSPLRSWLGRVPRGVSLCPGP